MIASLRGRLGGRTAGAAIVDVNGVGYLVQASAPTLSALGQQGEEVFLLVHTQVREDAITLFGFADADERDVFLMLITVQGVGPKAALSILSVLDPSRALAAIASGDRRSLCAADGVGARLAERIASELRDKASRLSGPTGIVTIRGGAGQEAIDDARTALSGLGFQKLEIERLLSGVLGVEGAPVDTSSIVSACLRASAATAA